jgi:hypothetical protein
MDTLYPIVWWRDRESARDRRRRQRAAGRRRIAEEREARRHRRCYCGPDDDFCAHCDVCGRPGHLQHFPGAAPVTGAWCTYHYWRLALLHPNGNYGRFLWLAALVAGIAVLLGRFG